MSLSNQVSFLKLASVLDEINTSKKDQKSKLLKHFILQFQAEAKKTGKPFDEELSFFPILRLLLPTYDRNRGPYGIKEYTLSKLYVRILCLNRGTKDYIKLTQYKAPKSNLGSEGGDFSEVAYSVLKTRCGKGGELSVADVNKHLDNIAAKHINHDQRGVESELQLLMSKMSALEQRWLIRMLLKDLHVGLGGAHVLNLFHQDARDLYDVCHNLQRVCSVLHNPSSQLHEIEVVLFEPFRPMLSRRLDIQAVETDLRDRDEYYVEPKHDGERFQLHLSGGKFKYFSRNGHEYTSTYGADVTCGILTPHIVPQLSADVESCILDGEMMCWNTKYGTYTSKGGNIDVKKLRLGNIHQPCFCVFDILFYNGTVLSNKPLSERLNILESMLSSRQGVIVHTPRTRIHSKSDILPALNKAIENREEGIVVKEPDAVYKPNSRKDGWYKIKPEYTEGAMVELDMLIIGGYYGKGSQRGIVSQFLLGLLDDSNTPEEGSANSGGPRFVSAGKVGIGLSMEELVDLSQKMSPHWIRTRVNQLPDQIVWNREKPDLWIPPQYSHILQVRATEVVRSESFKVNYCLRFPRIQAVRYDKTSSDCLTVEEFHRIRTQGLGKLCYESITGTGTRAGLPTRSPRKRKEVSLASEYTCTIQDGVTLLSHIFKGKTLCVMTGGDITRKQTLETAILEHSGRLVQNSGPGTWAIVVTDTNNLRVKNAVAANAHNVVLASWVERCVDSKCLVEWIPEEVLSLVGHDKIVFNNKFDCYGDSFTLPLRPSALPPLLSSMNSHPIPLPTPHELLLVERELYSTNGSAVFRGLQVQKMAQLIFRREKVYRQRTTPPSKDFKALYRFEERNVEWLGSHFLGDSHERRGGALSSKERMQVFLRYMGDPGFQKGIGEEIKIDQSTVSRTILHVSQKILEKADLWIQLPTEQTIAREKELWQHKYQFPTCIGAIDCTHVKIEKPGGPHADEYINRKNFASINVQATVNAEEKFTSVDASWPGSVHDSRIWKLSDTCARLRHMDNFVLLADSGYGIEPSLMTPYRNPMENDEIAFNNLLKKERVIIERCFGQVKRRFPILQYMVRVKLDRVPRIIVCCFILHNIAKYLQDEEFLESEEVYFNEPNIEENILSETDLKILGERKRRQLSQVISRQQL